MRRIVTSFLLALACAGAYAQTLAAPSRSIYKCTVNGKTAYSDAPCLGAQRFEIEPTRGFGRTAGRDVEHERQREMFAEAIRPLTGLDAKQLAVQGRRMKLAPEIQRTCRTLDRDIPETERQEQRISGELRELTKVHLFTLRQRHRDLRC